ncbi:alpha/beta hydrolase [Candidatus Poriferisocius sp.]|uniref:alpha/beta hydrolase n=1 Tax=Candidatus Poriferisocius sp. TaxID=3101276 RepID=UPI003B5B32E9
MSLLDRYPDLDPEAAARIREHGPHLEPMTGPLPAELLELARAQGETPPPREGISVRDAAVEGVPVWVYEHTAGTPTGILVYLHGGAFMVGSRLLMDGVALKLALCTGASVVSVEYRLAPEHPYPAGLDDAETVLRCALVEPGALGLGEGPVIVGGESAGGNLSAAVALRLRDRDGPRPAGQMLLYPGTDTFDADHPSRHLYDGLVLSRQGSKYIRSVYWAGRDLSDDPYAVPMAASDLNGLPPAFVMVGGCDWLRDEGLAYAARLGEAGVETEVLTCAGQPHAFLNLDFPAAADVYRAAGPWAQRILGGTN